MSLVNSSGFDAAVANIDAANAFAGHLRGGRKIARVLSGLAIVGGVATWCPKALHIGLAWRELGHSACEAPLIPHHLQLALLATATACEAWEVVTHLTKPVAARSKALMVAWIMLLAGGIICKGAHLVASWLFALGLPCGLHDGVWAAFFSPVVQLAVLLVASAWVIGDTVEAVLHWFKHRDALVVLRRAARLFAGSLHPDPSWMFLALVSQIRQACGASWDDQVAWGATAPVVDAGLWRPFVEQARPPPTDRRTRGLNFRAAPQGRLLLFPCRCPSRRSSCGAAEARPTDNDRRPGRAGRRSPALAEPAICLGAGGHPPDGVRGKEPLDPRLQLDVVDSVQL